MPELLQDIVRRNRAGERSGIWAACTAHPLALEACVEQAVADGAPLLIEATCNQVNQFGGYTGKTPTGFLAEILALAEARGLPRERLVLGGDHLGPGPWQAEPAGSAMAKAGELVAAFAAAGFTKIHLDASMGLGGDPVPLPPDLVAGRAAELCRIAEREAAGEPPVYVIGTEVPTPGGARETLDHVEVTRPADLEETIALHRRAFAAAGLDGVWERVIAVVAQPGVEFGHDRVVDFAPAEAGGLVAALRRHDDLVFEAHSTDYQPSAALHALVANHFAVLKVGPWLTYKLREAIFALDAIEREWLAPDRRAGARRALDAAMLAKPKHWQGYVEGSPAQQAIGRAFSLSDRSRYYWPEPAVADAVGRLLTNLGASPPPRSLVSQYLPAQHAAIRDGRLASDPLALIKDKVREVARIYSQACGT